MSPASGDPDGDFLTGPSALRAAGTGFYSLTATGGDLADMAAFDMTLIVLLDDVSLLVP